ncbi:hypothetical protein B0H13DRAFT_1924641 [Mycena leptocephala]|nr:hypothetical protein B0H13DRAFT_1924641 [Mycena leptocephala]
MRAQNRPRKKSAEQLERYRKAGRSCSTIVEGCGQSDVSRAEVGAHIALLFELGPVHAENTCGGGRGCEWRERKGKLPSLDELRNSHWSHIVADLVPSPYGQQLEHKTLYPSHSSHQPGIGSLWYGTFTTAVATYTGHYLLIWPRPTHYSPPLSVHWILRAHYLQHRFEPLYMVKMYRQVNETRIEYFDTAWTLMVTNSDRQPENSYYSKRLARAHVHCPLEVLQTLCTDLGGVLDLDRTRKQPAICVGVIE